MSLEEIAIKHGTLKVPHGYMPIYERFFSPKRKEKISLLEIGVHKGQSLTMWEEYFPKGEIVGVDKVLLYQSKDRVTTLEIDIAKDASLVHGDFDFIIDDGSHIASEQLIAFRDLWAQVKPGGYYVIEDLFSLYDEAWNQPQHTIVKEVLGRMEKILVGGDTIQEVHFFGRFNINGIMFLRKRYEEFRIQPLTEFSESA